MLPAYAELHCRSNFSFLTGASHPEELMARAAQLGYAALALTDECSVAGVVRAHEEMKRQGEAGAPIQLIVGSRFEVKGEGGDEVESPAEGRLAGRAPVAPADHLPGGLRLVLLAHNREGYGNLCELITRARMRAPKGQYRMLLSDLWVPPSQTGRDAEHRRLHGAPHCSALLIPRREDPPAVLLAQARWCAQLFGARAAIALERLLWADDSLLVERVQAVAQQLQAEGMTLPIVATGDVLMHLRSRKPAQDTLTAIRLGQSLADCGLALARNAEQHLRSRLQLAQLYQPDWLAESVRIAKRCTFRLDELRYEYPAELVPVGRSPIDHLRALTAEGALKRFPPEKHPQGVPLAVWAQVERELDLIEALRYEPFFLTVHDIVRFAREQKILCQGRGSAANSVVCWCLGITEVDPTQTTLLFERFISKERGEPPDIDVDFEHERREEVIQYIYKKYGLERCALAAALTTYRTRGAVRDVGQALGFSDEQIDRLAKSVQWFDDAQQLQRSLGEIGLSADTPRVAQWLELVRTLHRFPRHLSQHTGGFVIAAGKLSRLVPIEPAAMADRRVIQWDKDDLESLGLLKVDVLALGMLTAVRKTLRLMDHWQGLPEGTWQVQDIPQDDAATFEMARRADTVGVFQIESRAQQSMLPRLKPRCLYDLVVQVAIVRPGPIQGGMVHPYLERRAQRERGELPPSPHPALDAALGRTLGVPIFQEQVMQICMVAAGFSAGEADNLRRAMAAWRKKGQVQVFHERIVEGMVQRGYPRDFAEGIFRQIEGFGEYGFPESHAFSFALIAYVSAWLKCHEPEAFLAALLNSQPMGFYAPSQLVQDARRHGVDVRPVDVVHSGWDCTLERRADEPHDHSPRPAVRLGLRMVSGLPQAVAVRLVEARALAPFLDVEDLARRAALEAPELQRLAQADALQSLAGHRRAQLWAAAGIARLRRDRDAVADVLSAARTAEPHTPDLFEAPEAEAITLDYAATGLTLRRHPLALLRERLNRRGWRSAQQLQAQVDGARVWACGLVTMRQQPATAKGTVFVTLEDETGCVNVIVWRHLRERQRQALLQARLLAVAGEWQCRNNVRHLVARRLVDASAWLGELAGETHSRDFR